jgi:hypothetical protein
VKTLRCPGCGTCPASVLNKPIGTDVFGFTMVIRQVCCPRCGNMVEGEPGEKVFQSRLAVWKVDLSSLTDAEE